MAGFKCVITPIALLLLATGAISDKDIPVKTRFITTAESTLLQKESKIFVATLCERFNGHSINATVLLNNNPTWDPAYGVIGYYIVDSPKKGLNDSLCVNKDSNGTRIAICYVSSWNSSSDLYLIATAGEVDSIVFSIDIEIQPISDTVLQKLGKVHKTTAYKDERPLKLKAEPEVLTEIVNLNSVQSLVYHGKAHLNVNFCKNSKTTDNYKITSTVMGIDGKSSYAQYLCKADPCVVDGPNVINFEGKQLPNNVVTLTTQSGQYQNFKVLIVCWSGEYDPKPKQYVGHFQYTAQINKL